jgi:hypothetical protein
LKKEKEKKNCTRKNPKQTHKKNPTNPPKNPKKHPKKKKKKKKTHLKRHQALEFVATTLKALDYLGISRGQT